MRVTPAFPAIAAAAIGLMSPVTGAAQAARPERVQFAKGASSKIIKGSIRGEQSRLLLVRLTAGQTLRVTLASSNASANFNVTAPGAAEALFIGSISGSAFAGAVPMSGDYRIDLFLMRAAARRNETANFTLTIAAAR